MEEYKEFLLVFFNSISLFSSIFWVKPVAEIIVFGSLRICYINLRAKFDLFILIEFFTSSIIFENKIKGPRRKNVHRLDRANSYLWKTFLWSWLTWRFHVSYWSLITLNMEGWYVDSQVKKTAYLVLKMVGFLHSLIHFTLRCQVLSHP